MRSAVDLAARWRQPQRLRVVLALLGCVAWAGALALGFAWLPAQRQQLVAMRDAVASSAAMAARRSDRLATPPLRSMSPAERFKIGFASTPARQQRLEALLDVVARHGLQWQRSELRQTREAALAMARYQITLPLTGSYGAIRAMVNEALLADPGLSLDRLRVSRASLSGSSLEAETVWSLWMRTDDEGRGGVARAMRR